MADHREGEARTDGSTAGPGRETGATEHPVTIGVDFGTESGRVVLLDLVTGEELAVEEVRYSNGVIDERLPGSRTALGADWALQDPDDYLSVFDRGIPAAVRAAGVDPGRIVGIGVDFTSCTVLPVTSDGAPLSRADRFRGRPHAWTKLWKHHAAQPYADRLTEVASERGESFLARYGGRISSEWYFPKLLEVFYEDREVYDAMDAFVEAADWVVWQLTGTLARSACAAGYKAFWSDEKGLPPTEYFTAAYPEFTSPGEKLGTEFFPLGARAGTLRSDVAARLGLSEEVAVAVGNVDSFVSVPGAGVERAGTFVMVVGTSICDMVVHDAQVLLTGITGVVRDGILPGRYGYEAGQPAVGDMFAWFVDRLLGTERAARGDVYAALEDAAGRIAPGGTGLVAIDWWNGNRSVLADADLSGAIVGLTLSTSAGEVYRALLESVAYGTRRIVDNFDDNGLRIDEIVACGGIAEKSPLLMQLVADVTGRPVAVPASPQIPARGSAMFAAVAAGTRAGGFADLSSAVDALRPATAARYAPDASSRDAYARSYEVYRGLHDTLGVERVAWMHALKDLRRSVSGGAEEPRP
ncbi:MAG: ribulokinase [Actinomycetota bacterium]|nr:ribulokinase [Actinomycetota bacterium]